MSTISENAKAIFLEAVEKFAPQEWPDFLDQACAGDRDLRGRVEGLLQAHAEKDSLFDRVEATHDYQPLVRPGQRIGPYKIREQIGDGGMGVVFVAEQEKPLRRRVALKVIKPGMDSKAVLARFDAERNALALMNHPNIAKVLDAGTTDQGHPYFVMELIQGKPITEYCDQKKLRIGQRLELFTQVCNAVQHAHQKGVIHRDIKPTNILVTEIDGKPVPKVIDFGVAKALGANLTDRTVYTGFQSLIGTPLYMSPEQTQLSGVDVDTSSDVYSLGILLYELLTGTTPLSPEELKQAAQDEVLRRIRETEPPRPSNRISSLGETSSLVSECRGAQPEQLGRLVRGDLDWIVMKALEKDRNRRYKTADAFAADIGRHLTYEPVEARPPSTFYRLRRFCRRNRVAVGFATTLVLLVSVAVPITVVGWWSAYVAWMTLQETNDELAAAMRDWRRELIDRGIESALRGDLAATMEIVRKARNAGAPEDWCLLLKGLAENYGNDSRAAGITLQQAYAENPNNVAVVASRLMTINRQMTNQTDAEAMTGELLALEPSGEFKEYERLFLGWRLVYVDPEESMVQLEQALSELGARNRSWPIAQVFLAHAEAHVACERGDLDVALSAVERLRNSESGLPDSGLHKAIGLWARVVALRLLSDADEALQSRLNSEAGRLAEDLLDTKNAFAAEAVLALYYELADPEKADEVFRSMVDDWFGACRAAHFYRKGDMSTAKERLPNDIEDLPLAAIARSTILALEGREVEALRIYESVLDQHESSFVHAFALQVPLLCGDPERAATDAERLLSAKAEVPDYPFYRARTRLKFFAGHLKPDDFCSRMEDSHLRRLNLCYAHYAIALRCLAKDETESARTHLEKCLATNQYWCPEFYFAGAMLARLPQIQLPSPSSDK